MSHAFDPPVQLVKMLVNLPGLPGGLQVNHIAVDGLHDIVLAPSAALENVLVRNADGVHDGSRIVPEVVKPEIRDRRLFYRSPELAADLIGVSLNDGAFDSL